MASWKSTGTYVDEVPPLGANIVSGMWIFRVKRPPGSPPVFKARYVARGFSQRQGEFCRGEGILQSFTLPASPQKNGIAERGIGLVMEVARTFMIHVAATHFLRSFAVRYTAHQLNLWPRVSLLETSSTQRWTGEVGDASVFRVRGSRAFVRDMSANKLSARCIPCVFLGFPPDAPGWQFYHPTWRRVFPSKDVQFDESVPFYHLFPYRSAPPPTPPLFLAPALRVESEGAGFGGAEPRGAEPGGAELGGAEPEGVEPGGADFEGAESRAARAGVSAAGDTGVGGVGVTAGAGGTGGAAAAGPGGARTRGTGAAGTSSVGGTGARGDGAGDPAEPRGAGAGDIGASGAGAGGAGAGDTGAVGAGAGGTGAGGAGAGGAGAGDTGTVDPGVGGAGARGDVLGLPSFTGLTPPLLCPPPDLSQPPLQPASPLPAPSPYTEQTKGPKERREPESRPALPVRTGRRAPCLRPSPVLGTHAMALCPSSVPLRVPLPPPPDSSLPTVPDPESGLVHAASPTISRLLATVVTDPSFESTAASALVAKLVEFAAACRLDYATALVAESESAGPPSVGVECALGTDVLEDRQEDLECLAAAVPCFASMLLAPEGDPDAPDIPTPRSYVEAIMGPYSFQWQAAMDAEMASWNSTCWMHIILSACHPNVLPSARAIHAVDYFQTFSPTPKMTTLRVLLHVAAERDYELHSLDFSTAFLQGSLHEEIWLRRPLGFTGLFPASTQWSLRRPVYSLRQAPREWHDTLRTTLAALGFTPSTADPSLFLRTNTSLPSFYVLVTSGMGLVLGGRGPVVLTSHADASCVDDLATQRSSQGYTFCLGSDSVSWRSTLSSSVLSSSCEAEIYARAMGAQELRWLTYLLTDLGEQPRLPAVLYVDNEAMIALCQEHRLEHRTKHIALRYFLARELQ
ncbi:unnamed protein product [Closterium sp. NIES-54]